MEDYSFVGKDPGLKLPSYYLGFALAMYLCCSAEDYLWNVSFIEFFMLGVQKRIVYAMYILVIILFYTS